MELVVSPEILDEYERVGEILADQFPEVDLGPIIDLVAVEAQLVLPNPLREQVCEDPDDDKFLACAITAETRFIVTGDKQLLKVTGYRGIEIISPRKFLDSHLAEDERS
ncbi:MAG TPA: putative toxin-antitoxin system toxin component, PIN family [Rhodothermales bacterium]|nr:putative toxin-antitoxin system toxin component, PIN family [Rhodothermales bacterium]